jgi:hypothetical protein
MVRQKIIPAKSLALQAEMIEIGLRWRRRGREMFAGNKSMILRLVDPHRWKTTLQPESPTTPVQAQHDNVKLKRAVDIES